MHHAPIMACSVFVEGAPVHAGNKVCYGKDRAGHYIMADQADRKTSRLPANRGKKWSKLVAERVADMVDIVPVKGPVELELTFYMPRPKSHYKGSDIERGELRKGAPQLHTQRPDVLKLARRIEDALESVFYKNDSQIIRGVYAKGWALHGKSPGVLIKMWLL